MTEDWAAIERCMKAQAEASHAIPTLWEDMAMGTLGRHDDGARLAQSFADIGMGPNLLLFTGRAYIPVLTLKDDLTGKWSGA